MIQMLRTARGVIRSLRIAYGDREHASAMDRLYRQFVDPDDIVFDVGAHAGNRIAAFRRLGARVIAVEPQPALVFALNVLYGRNKDVVVEPRMIGSAPGTRRMMINRDNPSVSTASKEFIRSAQGAEGWEGQIWDKSIDRQVTTLDALIAKHGVPSFIKIDVEGFEAEALAGLSRPVDALSFEFTTIQRDMARACLDRCVALGFTRFNAALGESQVLGEWRPADSMSRWLVELPHSANSGDIYATNEGD